MEGSSSMEKSLRSYKNLPVWIVEDHNHVLEHIYRAISSKHLPFSGITMLHLDSHPDLQIATDIDADVVFDKTQLLSQLSIENWIMPAIYAGHIDKVIWLKPPWADQLPEGTRHVSVGKHKDTGKLRVSWPDVYFLSDVLYAPADKLQNAKSVTIATVTMETEILKTSYYQNVSASQPASSSVGNSSDDYHHKAKRTKLDKEDHVECKKLMEINQRKTSSCDNRTTSQRSNEQRTSEALTGCVEPICMKVNATEKTVSTTVGSPANVPPKVMRCGEKLLEGTTDEGHTEVKGHTEVVSKLVGSDSTPFVLDIDLDFFSTKNPFKDVYTKEQYEMLEDLYCFIPPADLSEAAVDFCQQQRAGVLEQLQAAIKACWEGIEPECAVDQDRLVKVRKLVSSLQAHPPEEDQLDSELIHMAGLTCDDHMGELPHHVSTVKEIESLLDALKLLLSRLPKPTIVTVARSSHDDYCPADQVDYIQTQVLKVLQSVYGVMDIHIDYETSNS